MKLTLDQLKGIEQKAVAVRGADKWIDSKPKPIRNWSLDELAKGKMFSQSMIKKIVSAASLRRRQHIDSKGWTKNKRMRSELRIPTALYLQPEFQKRYFPDGADEATKNRCIEQLKRDFPLFVTH